ncbi:MAG TPA: hypothetical protein PKC72_10135 [Chitinophagaceae bacterium]|nr:hypothetical protein [Chitinophagaceae bacterium]
MSRMKIFLSVTMMLFASVLFAQSEKTVSPMKAGTKLTDADIGFLSMVANADLSANRGNSAPSVTIGDVTYSAGTTLTAANEKSIAKAIKSFQKTYKAPEASRAGLCYYWYYYCDGYGYCYWYKYWYYC